MNNKTKKGVNINILDQFKLKGKTAIITGAARGLGKAMATGLAEAGANIVIPDLNYQGAQDAAEEIAEIGVKTMALEIDVTDEDSVFNMADRTIKKFGTIDILVNNAGIVVHESAEKMSKENWQDVINVNLTGVFLCSKAVANFMISNNGGSFINIASMSGYIVNYPQPQVSYNASKAGVIQMTKSLAAEWAKNNIRVNAIAPGYMETDMTKKYVEKNPEVKKHWIEPIPMKRMGKPEELKGTVIYLASTSSSYMTGHTLIIDGGYTIY